MDNLSLDNSPSITFSSCFYILKSKFNAETYIQWMNNMISIVNNFNLVIYTDEKSHIYIKTNNPRIKIIIKPFENFFCYKFKKYWISNHNKNIFLNDRTCWELNMLWSEKISFVNETKQNKYFETEFYGWCDIGYFRNRQNDLHTMFLDKWPTKNKLTSLDKSTIHYACVSNYIVELFDIINKKDEQGLPIMEIPPNQISIAGGFFIAHHNKIKWWRDTYYVKLLAYFRNDRLVKDDQIILADCIFSDLKSFTLHTENNPDYDNWFLFQRWGI